MRAGSLDRIIRLQRETEVGDDGAGNPITEWNDFATLRAQRIEASTAEFIRDWGTEAERLFIFRARFVDGVSTYDRLVFEDESYNIVEMKELGRREGLEFRCTRRGS